MNSYSDTLTYLYKLQHRGMKFGLRNTRTLLASVGNPHERFHSIHIAGTNGKGSTASFLASIVMESGYKTALYTSPHLLRFTERIRINGKEISQRRLVKYANLLRPAIESVRATFFEATTCIAFQYFADEEVDLAVIETGLGGRLDATNVVLPLVSVITNVSLEHREYLGNTMASIAREKGGIIKAGIPCVTGSEDDEVISVVREIARKKRARFFEARKIVSMESKYQHGQEVIAHIHSDNIHVQYARFGLAGIHQLRNARVAVAALEILCRNRSLISKFRSIRSTAVARGLRNVRSNTGIRGRLETLGRNDRYILDVAHNPAGVRMLVDVLLKMGLKDLMVVFGVMRDKEYPPMVQELARIARVFVAVAPKIARALPSRKLSGYLKKSGWEAVRADSVAEGIRMADKLAERDGKVLVTGSHFVVSDALATLERKKA